MDFFSKFPTTKYMGEDARNLLICVLPSRVNIDDAFIMRPHRIAEGETPEGLAYMLYDDAKLYWTILVINNIVNPFIDWPISDRAMPEFVEKKYGANHIHDVHHYRDNRQNGRWVDDFDEAGFRALPNDQLPYYIIPVSNEEYEREVNEKKRDILVINPRYIHRFVEAYNNAVQGKET